MLFVTHQNGETALIWACYEGKPEVVSVLLKAGARNDNEDEVQQYYLMSTFIVQCVASIWSQCIIMASTIPTKATLMNTVLIDSH